MTAAANPLPFYKYVPLAGLRRLLAGSIRFTQPSAFNDPFEFLPEIGGMMQPDAARRDIAFDLQAPRRTLEDRHRVRPVSDDYAVNDSIARDLADRLNERIGVFSLSRTDSSLLMWSHYADQYAGAVVEFYGEHPFFEGWFDVSYADKRPQWDVGFMTGAEPTPIADLCVKSDQWAYEREVRIVRSLADCTPAPDGGTARFPVFVQTLPQEAICAIILGERTPIPDQREIYRQLRPTAIALVLAAISHNGFEFRRETVKFNAPAAAMGPVLTPRTANIFSEDDTPLGEIARLLLAGHPMSPLVNRTV